MESILSQPNVQKVILSSEALGKAVPYLPLDRLGEPTASGRMQGSSSAATGNKGGN